MFMWMSLEVNKENNEDLISELHFRVCRANRTVQNGILYNADASAFERSVVTISSSEQRKTLTNGKEKNRQTGAEV